MLSRRCAHPPFQLDVPQDSSPNVPYDPSSLAPVPRPSVPLDNLTDSLRDVADRVARLEERQATSRFTSSSFEEGLRRIREDLAQLIRQVEAAQRRAERPLSNGGPEA